jgi:hypothetical protein
MCNNALQKVTTVIISINICFQEQTEGKDLFLLQRPEKFRNEKCGWNVIEKLGHICTRKMWTLFYE